MERPPKLSCTPHEFKVDVPIINGKQVEAKHA